MSQTIDVTGLPPDAVRAVESLVRIIREKTATPAPAAPAPAPVSVWDLFGKAPVLRSGEDIAKQIEEERASWGEP
jgi:hypothetical protein